MNSFKLLFNKASKYNLPLSPILTSLAILHKLDKLNQQDLNEDQILVILLLACKLHNLPSLVPKVPNHHIFETEIFISLDYKLFIANSAGLMVLIADILMKSNLECVELLKKLLGCHIDERVWEFGYFETRNNETVEILSDQVDIAEVDRRRLAFYPEKRIDSLNIHLKRNNSLDNSNQKSLECCLAILSEEDLVNFEIILGENRPDIEGIRKRFGFN